MTSSIENAIAYWTQPDLSNAVRVIAAHAAWGRDAERDLPLFLTPKVKELIGDASNKTALEIGCGVGRLLLPMAGVFRDVIGVDVCPGMVELSRDYLAPYEEQERIYVWIGDGKKIQAMDDSIDFVYSTIVFQHLPDLDTIRSYLREAHRILKPGGLARIQTFQGPKPQRWDPHWGWFFASMEEFAGEFESAGFEIVETQRDTLFALPERREPIEESWLWVTARKS